MESGKEMPVTDIKEIRILPPLAIARFGSSDRADAQLRPVDPADAVGFRTLMPSETLVVHPQNGMVLGA